MGQKALGDCRLLLRATADQVLAFRRAAGDETITTWALKALCKEAGLEDSHVYWRPLRDAIQTGFGAYITRSKRVGGGRIDCVYYDSCLEVVNHAPTEWPGWSCINCTHAGRQKRESKPAPARKRLSVG